MAAGDEFFENDDGFAGTGSINRGGQTSGAGTDDSNVIRRFFEGDIVSSRLGFFRHFGSFRLFCNEFRKFAVGKEADGVVGFGAVFKLD